MRLLHFVNEANPYRAEEYIVLIEDDSPASDWGASGYKLESDIEIETTDGSAFPVTLPTGVTLQRRY